jgi:RTX calcium-binding nonapeptide repeat (4 copies)
MWGGVACALVFGLALSPLLGSASVAAADGREPVCAGRVATEVASPSVGVLRGSGGNEVLVGTPRSERIVAGHGGDDRICGRGRHDRLLGGSGSDRIKGERGNDRIRAAGGRDRAMGGRGRDRIRGGPQDDVIGGGPQRDVVRGGSGRDVVRGGGGADRVMVIDGERDRVAAGTGNDVVRSRDGVADRVLCGPGDDTAFVDDSDVLGGCETVRLGSQSASFALPSWSDASWSDPDRNETIQTGDLDGDGDDELIGRGSSGIEAHDFDPKVGQWVPLGSLTGDTAPSDAGDWDQPQYYSTIQTADLDGDGADEVFARYAGGIVAWKYDPPTRSWTTLPVLDGPGAPSDAAGWDQPQYYSTIQAAHLFDDRAEQIFARSKDGIAVWQYLPESRSWDQRETFTGASAPSDVNGWDAPEYYSTIQSADLDGQGADEIFARSASGLVAWDFNFGVWRRRASLVGPSAPSDANDWDLPQYYSTIQAGDVDGDGADEVFARDESGIVVWKYHYDVPSFDLNSTWEQLPGFTGAGAPSDDQGWDQPEYYSTIQAANVDGGGSDEVIGRSAAGIESWALRGGDWVAFPTEGDFSDENSWNLERYYSTIQTADIDGGKADELLARYLVGMVTVGFDRSRRTWGGFSAQFPPFDSGGLEEAYQAINRELGGTLNPDFDLRQEYATGARLGHWAKELTKMANPPGVPSADWNEVKGQLLRELANSMAVVEWYAYLKDQTDSLFLSQSMDTTGQLLNYNLKSKQEMEMEEQELFESVLDGLEAFAAVEAVEDATVVLASLAGGAVSAGMAVDDMSSAIDGVEGTLIEIETQLEADFNGADSGLADAQQEIIGDYGLQTTVTELLNTGTWTKLVGDDLNVAMASAERNYSLSIWQTITPLIWGAYQYPAWTSMDYHWCGNPHKDTCDWQGPDGKPWQVILSIPSECGGGLPEHGGCGSADPALRKQLFSAPSDSCSTSQWDADCNLGVPPADVFLGQNGWENLPAYICQQEPGFTLDCTKR